MRGTVDAVTGRVVDLALLDGLAEKQILAPFRYRNLNEEVAVFRTVVPTTENLGRKWTGGCGKRGRGFPERRPRLEKVRIRETDRNICEISAQLHDQKRAVNGQSSKSSPHEPDKPIAPLFAK